MCLINKARVDDGADPLTLNAKTRSPARAQFMPRSWSSRSGLSRWCACAMRIPGMDFGGFAGTYKLPVTGFARLFPFRRFFLAGRGFVLQAASKLSVAIRPTRRNRAAITQSSRPMMPIDPTTADPSRSTPFIARHADGAIVCNVEIDLQLCYIPGTGRHQARVLEAGRRLELGLRVHADQFSCSGGALLAATLRAATAITDRPERAGRRREGGAAGRPPIPFPPIRWLIWVGKHRPSGGAAMVCGR